MIEKSRFQLGPNDDDRRLDRILRKTFPSLPLSLIYKSFREKKIKLNDRFAKPDQRAKEGDVVECPFEFDTAATKENGALRKPDASETQRAGIDIPLLFASKDLFFFNKPAGILVHGGQSSLDSIVRAAYFDESHPMSVAFSPGPLHRLDRNTSGLLAFSRTLRGARAFSQALRQGEIKKSYLGLIEGRLDRTAVWKDFLERESLTRTTKVVRAEAPRSPWPQVNARLAETEVRPLCQNESFTLVRLEIATGRTHQIRSQAAYHGYPLAGDSKYGGSPLREGYFLHSWRMRFEPRLSDDIPQELLAPLPEKFFETILALFGDKAADAIENEATR